MDLTVILKELRVGAGLTQKELAAKLGIGQSTIVGYEKGIREPTVSNLALYAKYFNVSIDYLLGLEDDFGVRTSTPMSDDITAEEKEMIKKIRTLRKESRELIEQMIDTLVGTVNSEANSKISREENNNGKYK